MNSPRSLRHSIAWPTCVAAVMVLSLLTWWFKDVRRLRGEHLFPGAASGQRTNLLTFTPASVEELVRTLDVVWEAERPPGTLPNVAPDSFPPGMDGLPVDLKKKTFLRSLAPHVVAANLWIRYERRYLKEILVEGGLENLDEHKRACLVGMAQRYRADLGEDGRTLSETTLAQLRRRVDVIPAGLALGQAAIESGWGASRFARLGNNLFGQWVFSADKGIVPKKRPEGANYSVARFDGLGQSVGAYLYNLNTFWAYRGLRDIRSRLRKSREPLDSMALAQGLELYSERRQAYVDEVRLVMRANRLKQFDNLALPQLSRGDWQQRMVEAGLAKDLKVGGLLAPLMDPAMLPPAPGSTRQAKAEGATGG